MDQQKPNPLQSQQPSPLYQQLQIDLDEVVEGVKREEERMSREFTAQQREYMDYNFRLGTIEVALEAGDLGSALRMVQELSSDIYNKLR